MLLFTDVKIQAMKASISLRSPLSTAELFTTPNEGQIEFRLHHVEFSSTLAYEVPIFDIRTETLQ